MLHANFFGNVPVGGVVGWLKTGGASTYEKKTGTNTSTTAFKLIDSGANFVTSGVKDWMIVKREDTAGCGTMQSGTNRPTGWSYVTSVGVCTTELTLKEDIFPVADGTGKTYRVYATPFLPENFVECNGQTLSDSESLYDGLVIPDINGCAGTSRFLRGKTTSGGTGGTETHSHTVTSHTHDLGSHTHSATPNSETFCSGTANDTTVANETTFTTGAASGNTGAAAPTTDAIGTLPSYYEGVWVMRIK